MTSQSEAGWEIKANQSSESWLKPITEVEGDKKADLATKSTCKHTQAHFFPTIYNTVGTFLLSNSIYKVNICKSVDITFQNKTWVKYVYKSWFYEYWSHYNANQNTKLANEHAKLVFKELFES